MLQELLTMANGMNSRTKVLRHGEASKEDLAGEIRDALNALMQLTIYYHVEKEVEQAVVKSIQRLTGEGHIGKGEVADE